MTTSAEGFPPGIEVRPTRPEDRDRLIAHLDALPHEDRRLRFFGSAATATHVDRWLRLTARGGQTFVALTTGSDGSVRCVGEAGYAPRGDGSAEFALSVAVDARGGLGTALLEHLRRAAEARGIRSLHGDVLTRNGPMNHLLRGRGGVTVDREDADTAGVIIATSHGVPPRPDDGTRRPRVLVEATGGRWSGETRLRESGIDVAVCPGPASRPASDPCPLLDGRRCDLVDGADVVVHDLDAAVPAHRHLAAGLAALLGSTPLLTREPGRSVVDRAAVERFLSVDDRVPARPSRPATGP